MKVGENTALTVGSANRQREVSEDESDRDGGAKRTKDTLAVGAGAREVVGAGDIQGTVGRGTEGADGARARSIRVGVRALRARLRLGAPCRRILE